MAWRGASKRFSSLSRSFVDSHEKLIEQSIKDFEQDVLGEVTFEVIDFTLSVMNPEAAKQVRAARMVSRKDNYNSLLSHVLTNHEKYLAFKEDVFDIVINKIKPLLNERLEQLIEDVDSVTDEIKGLSELAAIKAGEIISYLKKLDSALQLMESNESDEAMLDNAFMSNMDDQIYSLNKLIQENKENFSTKDMAGLTEIFEITSRAIAQFAKEIKFDRQTPLPILANISPQNVTMSNNSQSKTTQKSLVNSFLQSRNFSKGLAASVLEGPTKENRDPGITVGNKGKKESLDNKESKVNREHLKNKY